MLITIFARELPCFDSLLRGENCHSPLAASGRLLPSMKARKRPVAGIRLKGLSRPRSRETRSQSQALTTVYLIYSLPITK